MSVLRFCVLRRCSSLPSGRSTLHPKSTTTAFPFPFTRLPRPFISSMMLSPTCGATFWGSSRLSSSNAAILEDHGSRDDDPQENGPVLTSTTSKPTLDASEDLLHPDQLCNGTIPYPKSLSPSAIMEFKKCPQSFLFQYLFRLKQPTSEALAKGSMCHGALEKLFDLEPQNRTLQVLQNLFRSEWSRHRLTDTYRILFEKKASMGDNQTPAEWDLEAERECLKLLENYYALEDPRAVVRPNLVKQEIWLNSHFAMDPSQGITARRNSSSASPPADTPTFHVRGIVNRTLEKLFDLAPQSRTLQVLHNLFRSEWSRNRLKDTYRILFGKNASMEENKTPAERDLEAEREWGLSGLKLLENYYALEDPRAVVRPNPVKREIWLNSHLAIDPSQGITARRNSSNTSPADTPTFHVRGIVDRLDLIRTADAASKVSLRIVDYKTGKAPNLKYSPAMNEKIVSEAFYQLKIYALLLREKGAGKDVSFPGNEVDVRLLRLLYLNSESGKAVHWDLDMGPAREGQDALLQEVHKDLSNVWTTIVELVSQQDPKAFVGCDRSFCYCHTCRSRFVPGTLWEPSSAYTSIPEY